MAGRAEIQVSAYTIWRLSAICDDLRSEMQDLTPHVVLLAAMIGTALSRPLWSTLIGNNYLYPTPEVAAHYLAAYQDTPSPYYIYNVHTTNVAGVPGAVLAGGKPEISHVSPAYSFYYGTPIYDLRIPLNPIYPVLTPSHPGLPPRPILPPTTQRPFDEDDYDGVEKLDSKVDPAAGTKKPESGGEQDGDDSITVEAI